MIENENLVITNVPIFEGTKGQSSQVHYSNYRDDKIERLTNVFTQTPGFFTKNINNNRIDIKHNQDLLKKKNTTHTYNVSS